MFYRRQIRNVKGFISENVKNVIILIVLIFLWKRYNDIVDWIKYIFSQPTNYFNDSTEKLPREKVFYQSIINDIKEDYNKNPLSGWSGFKELYNLSSNELRFVTDKYFNSKKPNQTLIDVLFKTNSINFYHKSKLKSIFQKASITID